MHEIKIHPNQKQYSKEISLYQWKILAVATVIIAAAVKINFSLIFFSRTKLFVNDDVEYNWYIEVFQFQNWNNFSWIILFFFV